MILQEKIKQKAEGFGKLASVFLEGAEFALNEQWISVKDDLPCNHKELTPKDYTVEVLALDDCDSYIVVRMWKFHDKWVWGLDDLPITHWMTLPALPKE